MSEIDIEALRAMLAKLPKKQAETAEMCWEPQGDTLSGIKFLASTQYKLSDWQTEKITPHEIEDGFNGLAAAALNLAEKLEG